jgi:hypothetical protein
MVKFDNKGQPVECLSLTMTPRSKEFLSTYPCRGEYVYEGSSFTLQTYVHGHCVINNMLLAVKAS